MWGFLLSAINYITNMQTYARLVKKIYYGKCCMYKPFSFLYTINGDMDLDKLRKRKKNTTILVVYHLLYIYK